MKTSLVKRAFDILREWASVPTDGTSYPWWAITLEVKGWQRGEALLAGPFFSRETAEDYLRDCRHNFPDRARVYCFSGHQSPVFRELRKAAEAMRAEPAPKALPGAGEPAAGEGAGR